MRTIESQRQWSSDTRIRHATRRQKTWSDFTKFQIQVLLRVYGRAHIPKKKQHGCSSVQVAWETIAAEHTFECNTVGEI